MSDSLPSVVKKKEYGVVNLDSYKNPGTHWICYLKIDDDNAFVFDSFGGTPPARLVKYLSVANLYYNDKRIQGFTDVNCGHLCLSVLAYMSKINNPSVEHFQKALWYLKHHGSVPSHQRDFGLETRVA